MVLYHQGKSYTDGHGDDIVQLPSGGFVKCYSTNVIGNGGWDYFLVKVDANLSNKDSCNINQVSLTPYDFTSYMSDYSGAFTTTSISPKTGTGVKTQTISASQDQDTFACTPFVASFNLPNTCVGKEWHGLRFNLL